MIKAARGVGVLGGAYFHSFYRGFAPLDQPAEAKAAVRRQSETPWTVAHFLSTDRQDSNLHDEYRR